MYFAVQFDNNFSQNSDIVLIKIITFLKVIEIIQLYMIVLIFNIIFFDKKIFHTKENKQRVYKHIQSMLNVYLAIFKVKLAF